MILKLLKKKVIHLILLIYPIQSITIYASNQYRCNNTSPVYTNNSDYIDNSILIQSDAITVNYPQQIQFSGNIKIKHNNHTLTSDNLTLSYNNKKKLLYILYADGHVCYNNKNIILTGEKAWINLYNKNINIHNGTYHLKKTHIHGSADTMMQRKNSRYTIIKQGNFTTCPINNDCWNITGSRIIYDYKTNSIDIWNARFKIKKLPIFYNPYLSLSLNNKNIFTSCIPKIKYSNKYGLMLKIPCPIYVSKYIIGNISSYYLSNIGISLQTKIHYSIYPNTGLIIFNIIRNNKIQKNIFPKKNNFNTLKNIYWKHNNITYKKWHFHSSYISNNIPNYLEDHVNIANNYINQKFICRYNSKYWDASLAYLGVANNNIISSYNYNNYNAAPQLTLNSYYNFQIQKIPFTLKIFNQLTKFIPEILSYPEAIRIHTEPSIYYQVYNHWGNFNIETKIKLTHYRQQNIIFNNKTQHKQYYSNVINRIIPQFKIHGKIILKNRTHIFKKYQHFLESKLQYLYIPYCFQENIGIYDSSLIITDHNNFFNDSIYSGLDRIAPANQITGTITMRYLNNIHELFYISIGQILNFSKHFLTNTNIMMQNKQISSNCMLFSGVSHWNLNKRWKTHTEIQYDMKYHNLPFGTAILEYIGKNNYILQTHYRYINAQYIQKILSHSNESIYYQTIAQLGIFVYIPFFHNWKINYSHYYNTKTKKLTNHTIGIKYYTPCWKINTTFERKIIGFNQTKNNSIYDNKIKLNIKISHLKTHSKSDSCKILYKNMLPY